MNTLAQHLLGDVKFDYSSNRSIIDDAIPTRLRYNANVLAGIATFKIQPPMLGRYWLIERVIAQLDITPAPAPTSLLAANGSVATPGAGAAIASLAGLTVGAAYTVTLELSSTIAGDVNNWRFFNGAGIVTSPLGGTNQPIVITFNSIVPTTGTISVQSIVASTGTMSAAILATPLPTSAATATLNLYDGDVNPINLVGGASAPAGSGFISTFFDPCVPIAPGEILNIQVSGIAASLTNANVGVWYRQRHFVTSPHEVLAKTGWAIPDVSQPDFTHAAEGAEHPMPPPDAVDIYWEPRQQVLPGLNDGTGYDMTER